MKSKQKIKTYHIIILSLFLTLLLILNSNHANQKRDKIKLNEEKNKFFNKIISNRKLDGELQEQTDTEKICGKGSKELKEYYKTSDMSKIGLKENEGIKADDKDSKYMKALKFFIKKFMGDDDDDEEEEEDRIRRLEFSFDDETKNALIDYLIHFLPIIIFFVIGILAIPAWPVCCICCCSKCCCCCCCKKQSCEIPCFIFTNVFYGLVVGVCIYGIISTNKVFVGIADTECSTLKFFDEVLDGETSTNTDAPRWAGISGIQGMLSDISDSLNNVKDHSLGELDDAITGLDAPGGGKKTFLNELSSNYFCEDTDCTTYKSDYTYSTDSGDYVLDIIKFFGKFDQSSKEGTPASSTLGVWAQEFKTVSDKSERELDNASQNFHRVCGESFGDVIDILDKAQTKLGEFEDKFDKIKNNYPNKIIDYSDDIDKYGKLGSKAIFGGFGLLNLFMAFLTLFRCSCKNCKKCCCCRCICKLCTHCLWNILYLLMILIFFIGFIISLIGQIGNDGMNILSYILSEDNIGTNGDNFLSNNLGKYKDYINTCLNGQGNLQNLVNINREVLDALDEINSAETLIDSYMNEFDRIPKLAYNNASNKIDDMVKLDGANNDFGFILYKTISGSPPDKFYYKETLNSINNDNANTGFKGWNSACGNPGCEEGQSCFNPKSSTCDIEVKVGGTDSKNNAKAIKKIIAETDIDSSTSAIFKYKTVLDSLLQDYDDFIDAYKGVLTTAKNIINSITRIISNYIGTGGGFFNIVNCKFIGKNLKVLLYNLKSSLGGDVKTVGICLSVVGCSIILSIASTLILIEIINISIEKNKQSNKFGDIPEYPADSAGKVIRYKNI